MGTQFHFGIYMPCVHLLGQYSSFLDDTCSTRSLVEVNPRCKFSILAKYIIGSKDKFGGICTLKTLQKQSKDMVWQHPHAKNIAREKQVEMDTQRILYGEYYTRTTKKKKEVEFDISKALYPPYHPRARRLYNILKKDIGFDVI